MTTTQTLQLHTEEGMSDRTSPHDKRWWILAVLGLAQLMVIWTPPSSTSPCPPPSTRCISPTPIAVDRDGLLPGLRSLLLLGGRIGDIIGRKRALLIG